MIPVAHIQQWSTRAPWPELRQIEQDLLISRAICDLFGHPQLQDKIAFRGGTAINKLLFANPLRYSEDIDLVQVRSEPIKHTIASIRQALAWLGKCSVTPAEHSYHLVFKFTPETGGGEIMRLKVEINTREHEFVDGLKAYPFEIINDWHRGQAVISSFSADELFGTKLRALLQRTKGRDLFDIHQGLQQLGLDCDRVVQCLLHYLALQKLSITRAQAEERFLDKLNRSLTQDIAPLLPPGVKFDDREAIAAFTEIWNQLIARIPGKPWKSTAGEIEKIRRSKIPDFLTLDDTPE